MVQRKKTLKSNKRRGAALDNRDRSDSMDDIIPMIRPDMLRQIRNIALQLRHFGINTPNLAPNILNGMSDRQLYNTYVAAYNMLQQQMH